MDAGVRCEHPCGSSSSAPRALIARTAEVAHPLAVGDWPATAHPVRKAAARMAEAISGRVLFNLSLPFEMGPARPGVA
jgi:hypothetical protein